MRLVQVTLTDDQAMLLHGAAAFAAEHADDLGATEEEVSLLQQLAMFFALVGQEPERFPVTTVSTKVKSKVRAMKGPAQTPSRRNRRKARQEKRQSAQKRMRVHRKEIAANWNRVRAEMEAMMKEAEEAANDPQARIDAAAEAARHELPEHSA